MKQSRLRLENDAEMLSCGSFDLWDCSPHAPGNMGCCIPNCASRRRKKAIEKENAATLFQAQRLFSSSKLHQHCAKRTMGVALPLPGCGGGISPHIQKSLRRFLKGIGSAS